MFGNDILTEVPLMTAPLIDGLFHSLDEGSVIFGPPRSGKTRYMVSEICSLLFVDLLPKPITLLGQFKMTPPAHPLKIMLIQAESSSRAMRVLFQATLRGLGFEDMHDPALNRLAQERFRLFTSDDYCFSWFHETNTRSPLLRHLKFKPDIIYVDALTDIVPEIEKPSVESRFVVQLRELEHDLGYRPAWRFLHHTSIGGKKFAGGFPLRAYFRSYIQLNEATPYAGWSYLTGQARAHDATRRDIAAIMKVEGEPEPYRIQYVADKAAQGKRDAAAAEAVRLLSSTGEMLTVDLQKQLTGHGYTAKTARDAIEHLVEVGEAIKFPEDSPKPRRIRLRK